MTTQTPDPEQAEATPDASPSEKTTVRRPRWKPTPDTSPDPSLESSRLEAGTAGGSDVGPDSVAPSEQMPADKPRSSGSSPTSSRAETRKALYDAVRVGFASVTTIAHELLVKDPYAKYAELFLADEQDLDAVAGPGSNLVARRVKDAPLGGELADGIGLAIGVAGYLLKQVSRIRYARQLRDGGAVIDGLQPDLEQQGQDEDPSPGTDTAHDFPLSG